MLCAKETGISSGHLGLWLKCALPFFFTSFEFHTIYYSLMQPKLNRSKNGKKTYLHYQGVSQQKMFWGGGNYGDLNLFVTAHKKVKLQERKI